MKRKSKSTGLNLKAGRKAINRMRLLSNIIKRTRPVNAFLGFLGATLPFPIYFVPVTMAEVKEGIDSRIAGKLFTNAIGRRKVAAQVMSKKAPFINVFVRVASKFKGGMKKELRNKVASQLSEKYLEEMDGMGERINEKMDEIDDLIERVGLAKPIYGV